MDICKRRVFIQLSVRMAVGKGEWVCERSDFIQVDASRVVG